MNIAELFTQQQRQKLQQKNTSSHYRIQKLLKIRNSLLQNKEQIAQALQKDLGKAELETYVTEVFPVLSMLNQSIKNLNSWMKPKKVKTPLALKGASSYIRYEGKGNCLVLSPWNYPFQLTMYPVINSFMCGNTTILKPSEFTPHTNKIIEEILDEVFSKDEFAVVNGGVEVSTELLSYEFDHIFFTGSTQVGKIVMEAASKNLASVALELGGKSPVYLDKTANISESMRKISWAKLVNAGQTCVAPDYLLTSAPVDKVIEGFKSYLEQAYASNFAENEDYCDIITSRHAQRLQDLIKDAIEKGAEVLVGGSLLSERCLEPTLIAGVTPEMKIMQEEIFGPILPVVYVDGVKKAVEYINKHDNALASYVFAEDKTIQEYFLDNTYSGVATVNDLMINVANVNLPFGGAGKSGIGKYHGHEGFLEFSNARSVMDRKVDLGASYLYPPYNGSKKSNVNSLFKRFSSFL